MNNNRKTGCNKLGVLHQSLKKAEYELLKTEADVKKVLAMLKTKAMSEGHKTNTAQETYAENQDELYQARLKVGVAKGFLSSCKVQLKALEIGFEEWRTKMVNAREGGMEHEVSTIDYYNGKTYWNKSKDKLKDVYEQRQF